MKKNTLSLIFLPLMSMQSNAQSSFVLNFNDDLGGPGATVSDFQAADSSLVAEANFFAINDNGLDAEVGFVDFRTGGTEGPLMSGFLSISTVGEPQNDGFAVPAEAHNFDNPITGSNLFDTQETSLGIDVSGISSLASGTTFIITAWGIGDNRGQQVLFEAAYGSDVQTGLTRFNDITAVGRDDATGSVPFVQFTFTADGATDLMTLRNFVSTDADTEAGGGRTHFNGLSFSVVGDVVQPNVTISSVNETVSGAFTVDAVFNEDVTDLDASEFVVSNGVASVVSPAVGPATTYSVTITPTATGVVSIDLPSGAAQNSANAGNLPSNSLEVLAVLAGSEQANVTLSTSAVEPVDSSYTVDVVFDEQVDGLDLSDFVVVNGVVSDLMPANGPASVYSVTVSPVATGDVELTLMGAGVTDVDDTLPATDSNTLMTNFLAPTVPTVTLGLINSNGAVYDISVQISEDITGLELSDFVVINGTASNLDTSMGADSATVQVTTSSLGFASVSLAAGSVTDLDGNSLSNPESNTLLLQMANLSLPALGDSLTFEAEDFNSAVGVIIADNVPEASGGLYIDNVEESGSDPADGDFFRFEVVNVNAALTYELNYRHRRNGGGLNVGADATLEGYAATETNPDVFTYTLLGTMTSVWQDQGWNGEPYYQSAADPDAIVFDLADAAALQFQLPAGTTHIQFEFADAVPAFTTARVDRFTITGVPFSGGGAISVISTEINASGEFDITFSGLDTAVAYELHFSPDLETPFTLVPGSSRVPATTEAIYSDLSPALPGKGFYQLFVSP